MLIKIGKGGVCPESVHRPREKVKGTESLYKYVDYLFMKFGDARAAQAFLDGHDTLNTRQRYEGVLRVNVHNELRFPMSSTTKPPWMRVVPREEGQENVEFNHSYLLQKEMEDHFDQDIAVLQGSRETPAVFVPLARSTFTRSEASSVGAAAATGSKRDASAVSGAEDSMGMEMTAEDEAFVFGRGSSPGGSGWAAATLAVA